MASWMRKPRSRELDPVCVGAGTRNSVQNSSGLFHVIENPAQTGFGSHKWEAEAQNWIQVRPDPTVELYDTGMTFPGQMAFFHAGFILRLYVVATWLLTSPSLNPNSCLAVKSLGP